MIFIAKVVGLMLVVGIPTSIGGIQLYLKNNKISAAQKEVVQAIQKTAAALQTTKENFNKEITRITTEKNELATTKNELTYKPVVIQTNIDAMDAAKTAYEGKHSALQASITAEIATHKISVTTKQSAIEGLWTVEKKRVEALKKTLDDAISNARAANKKLQEDIETLKSGIQTTINEAFSPTIGGGSVP